MSDSLQPHGLQSARLLLPWNFPDKHTGVVAISFSRASSWPSDRTWVSRISCISRWILCHCAPVVALTILGWGNASPSNSSTPPAQLTALRRPSLTLCVFPWWIPTTLWGVPSWSGYRLCWKSSGAETMPTEGGKWQSVGALSGPLLFLLGCSVTQQPHCAQG